jgi:hypothetical protein
MTAKSLVEVRDALSGTPVATSFAKGFADAYFAQALGVLPKTEIDLLVFRLLIEANVVDPDGSIFAIARALNLTPAKARNLLFQYQLRCIDDTAIDTMVLQMLSTAKFSVDDKRLSFGIESPLVRATVDGRLKANGVFADISLSGDILKVPLAQFGDFIAILLTAEKATELEKALKDEGHLKKTGFIPWLNKYAAKAGEGAAGAAGKQAFGTVFSGIAGFFSGDGLTELGGLIEMLG